MEHLLAVYIPFNNSCKINDPFLILYGMSILRQVRQPHNRFAKADLKSKCEKHVVTPFQRKLLE